VLRDARPARLTHPPPQAGIAEQPVEGGLQSRRVQEVYEQSGAPVLDGLGGAAGAPAHAGPAEAHRLQEHDPEALLPRGKHEEGAAPVAVRELEVGEVLLEDHAVPQAEARGQRLKAGLVRSLSHDPVEGPRMPREQPRP